MPNFKCQMPMFTIKYTCQDNNVILTKVPRTFVKITSFHSSFKKKRSLKKTNFQYKISEVKLKLRIILSIKVCITIKENIYERIIVIRYLGCHLCNSVDGIRIVYKRKKILIYIIYGICIICKIFE